MENKEQNLHQLKNILNEISSVEDQLKVIVKYLPQLPNLKELLKLLIVDEKLRIRASGLRKQFEQTLSPSKRKDIVSEYESLYRLVSIDERIFLKYLQNWKMSESVEEILDKEESIKNLFKDNMSLKDILYIKQRCNTTIPKILQVIDKCNGVICFSKS